MIFRRKGDMMTGNGKTKWGECKRTLPKITSDTGHHFQFQSRVHSTNFKMVTLLQNDATGVLPNKIIIALIFWDK